MQQCDFSSAEEPGGFPDAKQSPVQTMPLKGAVGKLVLKVVLSEERRGPIAKPAQPETLKNLGAALRMARGRHVPRIQINLQDVRAAANWP